ncbi:MAG: hypothetical protein PVG66_04010 [Chromatiales bacterium]|jgi:hypothetical protein
MRIFTFLLVILLAAFIGVEHFALRDLDNAELIHQTHEQILSDLRQQSMDSLNKSIENDSLGKIVSRAANVLTTDITLIGLKSSQSLLQQQQAPETIIQARFLVENSNEQASVQQRYLRFQQDAKQQWIFAGDTTIKDFYMNLLRND